jgi:phage N-6-adenine-methyltransferase
VDRKLRDIFDWPLLDEPPGWVLTDEAAKKYKSNGEKLSDCWKTPRSLFDQLAKEFPFTLDAAADDENHLCDAYYTFENSALENDWAAKHTFVYCNPPYSDIRPWVAKASEESRKGATTVMVLKASPNTEYWHDYIWEPTYDNNGDRLPWVLKTKEGVKVRWTWGRVSFDPPEGLKASTPRHETAIVIFHPIKPKVEAIDSVTYPWDDHD